MLTGFPTSASTGHNEEMLLGFNPAMVDPAHMVLPLQAAPGCGNQRYVYGADGKVADIITLIEGAGFIRKIVTVDALKVGHSAFCEPLGSWNTVGEVVVTEPTSTIENTNGQSEEEDFDVSAEVVGSIGDNQQLASWVLAGVTRWNTCRIRQGSKTDGELDVTLVNVGSVRTVTVSLGTNVLAQGSRTGNGSITLAAIGGSGVSGTVAVTYTADVTSGCVVVKRWASSYVLAASGVTKTVVDPGQGERLSAIIGPIPQGTTNLVNTPYSDTGAAGTPNTTSITIPGAPQPITNITYVSGGTGTPSFEACAADANIGAFVVQIFSGFVTAPTTGDLVIILGATYIVASFNAGTNEITLTTALIAFCGTGETVEVIHSSTRISFNASTTVGATYKLYLSTIGGPVDVSDVVETFGPYTAGSLQTITLPAIASGNAGSAYVMIVATAGGIEDGLRFKYGIDYNADGTHHDFRGNVPSCRPRVVAPVTSGRTVQLQYTYDGTGADAVATKILPRWEYQNGTITVGSASNLASGGLVRTGILPVALSADGFYRLSVASQTAGAVNSAYSDWTDWIYVSNAAMPAPGNVDVFPVG